MFIHSVFWHASMPMKLYIYIAWLQEFTELEQVSNFRIFSLKDSYHFHYIYFESWFVISVDETHIRRCERANLQIGQEGINSLPDW